MSGLRLEEDLMRQQGVVANWRRGIDAEQDRAEPVVGVDAVGMARGKGRAVHGDVLGSGVRSGKETVLAAEGNRTDGVFHQVVVDLQMTVMAYLYNAIFLPLS